MTVIKSRIVSLVLVVSQKLSEENSMEEMDDPELAEALIYLYGLDINHWLNTKQYQSYDNTRGSEIIPGIAAIIITDDMPNHLARMIGHGLTCLHESVKDAYTIVQMNKVNL